MLLQQGVFEEHGVLRRCTPPEYTSLSGLVELMQLRSCVRDNGLVVTPYRRRYNLDTGVAQFIDVHAIKNIHSSCWPVDDRVIRIDSAWNMHSYILATREDQYRHTAENIRNMVAEVLVEYEVNQSGIVYVIDHAANMKAAYRNETWVGCSGHNINLVLSHGLQPPKEGMLTDDGLPEEITQLISVCEDLVTLAKWTKLNQILDKTLKQCVTAVC